ncbi:MAG TPA: trimeric intracellular cation channel family protein [Steroidobacteraceae bacterium]|nr:trimeric intracellular cation channel family protein [Steroidobacteraceae bacterium]
MPSFGSVVHNAPVLLVIDLIGVFVFALAGATAAVRQRLDLFGVLVLSFATATTGGIIRDLLIGAVPPAAFADTRYLAAAVLGGLVTFMWHPLVERMRNPVRVFDAAGLGLFAVAGTQKALAAGLHPVMAALLGMLTGIGGGVMRDLLLTRVPVVFQSDIYALAALAGASIVVLGHWFGWPEMPTAIAGALLCFALRILAMWFNWHMPRAHNEGGAPKD